jgi:phage anti-repressor protein
MDMIIKKKAQGNLVIPETVNFTSLIENTNTIKSLGIENSKLITILNQEFTEQQQKHYITNLYLYLKYHPTTDYPVNLESIYKPLGFANKGNAMKAIKSNFTVDEDYKILLFPTEKQKKTDNRGGQNKEDVMLNVDSFKSLCMLVKTPEGKEMRKYYVKLENINNRLIKEELEEQKLLLEEKDKLLEEIIKSNDYNKKLERHKLLLEKFKNKKCIYVLEIIYHNENGHVQILIKMGSTHDIAVRFNQHKTNFKECLFLDVFECDNYREIEQNMLNNDIICNNKIDFSINGVQSREIVELTEQFNYQQLLKIIKDYIKNGLFFIPENTIKLRKLDNEKMQLEFNLEILDNKKANDYINNLEKIKEQLKEIVILQKQTNQNNNLDNNDIDNIDNVDNNDNIDNVDDTDTDEFKIKFRKAKGRKIQQIDADNLQRIIKVYDSMTYLLREKEHLGYYKQLIQNSIKNKTIYKGYRWMFVEKTQDPSIVHNIEETVVKRAKCIEYVLKLNIDKTEILDTYTGIKPIAKTLKKDYRFVKKMVEDNESYLGFYYTKMSQCPENLLNNYTKPLKRYTKKVVQINAITKDEITHDSINQLSVKFGKTIQLFLDAIKNKNMFLGSFWKFE